MAEDKKAPKKRPNAEKRMIQNTKSRLINRAFKSKMRSSIRTFEESLSKGNKEDTQKKLNEVYGSLDKAVKRGIIKINNASRTKARLTAKAIAAQSK